MKKNSKFKVIILVAAILLLGVGLAAALTQGFTNANPYGWLPEKGKLEKDNVITGFKLTNGKVDYDALAAGLKKNGKEVTLEIAAEEATISAYPVTTYQHKDYVYGAMYVELPGKTSKDVIKSIILGVDLTSTEFKFDVVEYIYVAEDCEFNGFKLTAGWNEMVTYDDLEGCFVQSCNNKTVELWGPFVVIDVTDYEAISRILIPVMGDQSLAKTLKATE